MHFSLLGSFNLTDARWRHQQLLQEGQCLLARYQWIKKRDSLHADVQAARKSREFELYHSRQVLLDEHVQTTSRVGISEGHYYTFPVRLLQSYYDLEGSPINASTIPSAEVYHALDTKLQILSQQRAGIDGIPLKNVLTGKNCTIEELFQEIEVLQQALSVPRTDPSAPAESLPFGQKVAVEDELLGLLNRLVLLNMHATQTSSARGMAHRSATGSGGNKVQQDIRQPTRVFSIKEFTQEMNELKVLAKSASEKRAAGAPHNVDQLIQRVRNLQQVLSGVDKASSDPFTPSEPGDKSTNVGKETSDSNFILDFTPSYAFLSRLFLLRRG